MSKGLNVFDITESYKAVLDADNIFWAILSENHNGSAKISRDVLDLYEKFKKTLDSQMRDFRFGINLSAVYIAPTDKCNANCPYCYVPPKIRKYGRSMNKDELIFILNKIYAYVKDNPKKLVIVFHASEPLLVKNIIFSAIEEFKDRFLFGLQTNAILLEKSDVDFLVKNRVGVGISLDSYDAGINNLLRSGNFHKATKALEWFNGYPALNVITTVTKYNVSNLSRLVKFLHAKKVPCVLLNPMRLTQNYSRKLKPNESVFTHQFIKAVDTAIELTKKTKRQIIIANFTNIILGIVSPTARRLMCDVSPCGGGRCFFTITAKGEIIPCGEFIGKHNFSGGNIFRDKIDKAINSDAFNNVKSRFVEKIKECDICNFRNICGSPCPAELYALNRFNKKAVFCEFYKALIQHAFKLIAEDKVKYLLRNNFSKSFEYEYNLDAK